jgi:DNA-binding NarL/FixJ family response regulator
MQPLAQHVPLRVAVVDDNEDIRVLIGLHLELDDRFECTVQVGTGDEAIALVTRTDIDAMILDMHMPGVSGSDVLRAIREAHSTMRVVAFSADAYTLEIASVEGAAATVLKGDNLESLVEALLEQQSVA